MKQKPSQKKKLNSLSLHFSRNKLKSQNMGNNKKNKSERAWDRYLLDACRREVDVHGEDSHILCHFLCFFFLFFQEQYTDCRRSRKQKHQQQQIYLCCFALLLGFSLLALLFLICMQWNQKGRNTGLETGREGWQCSMWISSLFIENKKKLIWKIKKQKPFFKTQICYAYSWVYSILTSP